MKSSIKREQNRSQISKLDGHTNDQKVNKNSKKNLVYTEKIKWSPESRVEKIFNERNKTNNKQKRDGGDRIKIYDYYEKYNKYSQDSESTRSELESFLSSEYTYDSEYDTCTDENTYGSESYESSYTDGSTCESGSYYTTGESTLGDYDDSSVESEDSVSSDEGRNRKRVVQFKDTIEINETILSSDFEDRQCGTGKPYALKGIIGGDPILWQCLQPIDEKKETLVMQEKDYNPQVVNKNNPGAIEERSLLKMGIADMLRFPCGLPNTTNYLEKSQNFLATKKCASYETPNIEMTLSDAQTVRDRSAFVENTEKLPLDNDAAIRELTDSVQVVRIDQWKKYGNEKANQSSRSKETKENQKTSNQQEMSNNSWTSFAQESQGSNSTGTYNTRNISLFHNDIQNTFRGSEFAQLSNNSSLTSSLYNTKVDLYKTKGDDNDNRLDVKNLRKARGSFRHRLHRTKRRQSRKPNESFDLSSAGTLSNLSHDLSLDSSVMKKASLRGSITRMKKKVRQKRFGRKNDDCYLLLNEEEYALNDQDKDIVIDPFSNSFQSKP